MFRFKQSLFIFVTMIFAAAPAAAVDRSADYHAALVDPDVPYADVEAAMLLFYDDSNLDQKEAAEEFFQVIAIPVESPLLKLGPVASLRRAKDLLRTSSYRKNLRATILREIDLLQADGHARRPRLSPMRNDEAWRLGRRMVEQRHSAFATDPAKYVWDVRVTSGRNLNREVLRPWPVAARPTAHEVRERLMYVQMDFIKQALVYFFLPPELSLYRELDDGTYQRIKTFALRAEVEALDLAISRTPNELITKADDFVLGLTDVKSGPATGIVFNGDVIAPSAWQLGMLGARLRDHALDAMDRPTIFEGSYQFYLANRLANAIRDLESGRDVDLVLRRLRADVANDLDTVWFERVQTGSRTSPQFFYNALTLDDPDYFVRRDRRAKELGRPSLVAHLRREAAGGSLNRTALDLQDALLRGARGFAQHVTLGARSGPPSNTPRATVQREDNRALFRVEGSVNFEARRVYYDLPVVDDVEPRRQQRWTGGGGPEIFALTSAGAIQPVRGAVALPSTSYGRLTNLRVTEAGRALIDGVDYTVRTNASASEIILRLNSENVVDLRLGFAAPASPYLPAAGEIDFERLAVTEVVAQLRRGRLTTLADRLARAAGSSGHLSVDQILAALDEEFRYSYDEQYPRHRSLLARGPFAAYSGFLDRNDKFQLQCDGANAIFTEILTEIFARDPRIEVRKVTCLVQSPLRGVISRATHARTHVFFNGARAAIFDATPAGSMRDTEGLSRAGWQESSSPEHVTIDPRTMRLDRIRELRERVLDRRIAQTELEVRRDPSRIIPTVLRLAREVRLDEGGGAGGDRFAEATRYRAHLTRAARTADDGLSADPVALSELDEILRLVQKLSETCEDVLAATEAGTGS